MSLPQSVIDFLYNSAQANGATQPGSKDDLFAGGTLDSFALVDFVTVLEEQCDIRVPDAEVIPANFRTIEAIEEYVNGRLAQV
jgi:acyl carrier protein